MIVEPVEYRVILILIEFHLDRLQWLHVQDVVAIVERRLFVIERREAHPFKMASVAFLSPHHNPHGAPLGLVDRFNHFWGLVDEGDRASDMIQDLDSSLLLPRHGHIFEKFENGVRDILQGTQIHSLILSEAF